MAKRRWSQRLALCGAAALALAGCGSSGSSASSGPTKAQYVAKADAICKAAGEKTAPLISKLVAGGAGLASGSASAAHELAPVVGKVHEYAAASLTQLRALERPKGEASAIEKFLSPLSNVVGAAGQAASSLSSGQGSAALGLLAQVQTEAQQATKAASAYGVAPCASVVAALG
jgi:hypothetical protein